MQTARRVRLTYPPDLLDQPIIYSLIKQFDLITNIRTAQVDSPHGGWLIVDLTGSPAAIERALAWAREQGVQVETLPGD